MLASVYNKAANYFDIDTEYRRIFPDCNDTWQIGGFVAARERIQINQTIQALIDGTVRNIVVLASGLSATGAYLRDYVSRQLPTRNIQVFCTDLAEPLCLQRALCRHILASHNPRGISFQPLNVLEKRDWDALDVNMYEGGVAIICEGLLGYFSQEKIAEVITNAKALLAKRSGFLMTDIATKTGLKKTLFAGDSAKLLDRFYAVAGVRPEELAFDNSEQCLQYLGEQGLQATRVGLRRPESFYMPDLAAATDRAKLMRIINSAVCIDIRLPRSRV